MIEKEPSQTARWLAQCRGMYLSLDALVHVEVQDELKIYINGAQAIGEPWMGMYTLVEVTQKPFSLKFKLYPHVKPYFIEGPREMIEEGYHREAVLWIAASSWISTRAIQLDAPEDDKPSFLAASNKLLSDLRLTSPEENESRVQQAKEITEHVFKVADFIVNENSEITL